MLTHFQILGLIPAALSLLPQVTFHISTLLLKSLSSVLAKTSPMEYCNHIDKGHVLCEECLGETDAGA